MNALLERVGVSIHRSGPDHTYSNTYLRYMKAKLTLSVDRVTLAKARRKLERRGRSISAEVEALLGRIATEAEPDRKGWIEQFGDLRVPLDMREAESGSWQGAHLRKTGAYRASKAARTKKAPRK